MRDDRGHASCRRHVLRRARDRQIHFDEGELDRLEDLLDRARALFERPDRTRYKIGLRRGRNNRIWLIYDIDVGAIVTVFPRFKYSVTRL